MFRRESVSPFRRDALRRAEARLTRAALVRDVAVRLATEGRSPGPEEVRGALEAVLASRGLSWDHRRLEEAARSIADELGGLGPLGPLVRDPSVTEIMVNAPGEIFVERGGRLERVRVAFRSEEEVRHLIERVVSPLGLRVDASSPWVDARLPDGSRFHAVVPPLAVRGAAVTIRKFASRPWSLEDLVSMGTVSRPDAALLAEAVRQRRNVLVSGGAGAGKTTMLGVLAGLVPEAERIITIEDAAELRLGGRHVVALETRPPNVEGRGEVTMRDLVRCAQRMRPDRIVVGEVRGPEAFDMIQALSSGHAGSMATVHANGPADALVRLEAMALLAAPGLSAEGIRRQLASAIDLVVHMARKPDGRRRVVGVAEVRTGARGEPSLRLVRGKGTE